MSISAYNLIDYKDPKSRAKTIASYEEIQDIKNLEKFKLSWRKAYATKVRNNLFSLLYQFMTLEPFASETLDHYVSCVDNIRQCLKRALDASEW